MSEEMSGKRSEDEPLVDEDSMEGKYLTFVLAAEGYGLEIRYVTEIIGIQEVIHLPEMPDYVKGVVNLRGKVIPVIDMRLRFRLPEHEYDDRTCIVVVNVDDRSVGLVVDKVSEVIDIPTENIEPPPRTANRQKGSYIRGLGKVGGQVKILLNIEELLQDEEITAAANEESSELFN